ncbi:hypothetical protein RclHR1_10330005 [Rhizophagus clarus]|uniref:Targeting protein for Xklp2 homolog n=1 Tax=Rhizophagus clarus TaxID=94130 RepID=A0A2Z6Q299_9GLOM|nr:hypothetical protein RclHR1_10330005 [Rhizophagus clarus]GES80400.1 targeting protein for Xklp2 homolog [Rhizophagus clarus]
MDITNFNNDKPGMTKKFKYMEEVSQITYDAGLSVTSSTQSLQTKNYLTKKSDGVQKRAFVPTIPKPFKFHTALRVNPSCNKENSPKSPYTPLAVKVQRFLEKPTKFDAKENLKSNKVRTVTVPRSPYLRTKYRSKPTTVLPTEERKLREMQSYKFKANPVDRRIFENIDFGNPKVQKQKLTEPHSPAITKLKTPRPMSPSPLRIIKANPVPDHKEPYRPVIERRYIDLPDFVLPGEEISKRKSQEIEDRIRREREEMERMREFRAQPLPTDSPDCLPTRLYYPPTHPRPFSLLTDNRGEKYQREFHERVKREHEYEKEIQFHAQPLPNFEPEIPRKPECPPPTEPVGFFFHTDTRMEERHTYDEHRRLRDKEAEEQREQRDREEETRNAEEIRRLRADLVHHAQPIRHYPPIIIQPSNKKPTRPVSPMIGEKRRKYMQMLNNYEYFKDDLDNMDDDSDMSNVEPVLYSADQITNTNVYGLTPIAECETEFQDIIMADSVSSEQVQREEMIMNEVTFMSDEIDSNKLQN